MLTARTRKTRGVEEGDGPPGDTKRYCGAVFVVELE